MPALVKSVPKSFTKEIISKGYGFHTPQDGSVCRIKILSDDQSVMGEVDENCEKEIVIGDVDEPIERIIEDSVRTMKEEEICYLRFEHPYRFPNLFLSEEKSKNSEDVINNTNPEEDNNKDVTKSECENEELMDLPKESVETSKFTEDSNKSKEFEGIDVDDNTVSIKKDASDTVEVKLQLLTYTREPEIWEMSITEKWRRASYHKQKGLDLYSRGEYQYAFRRFGLTLKYVISLEHDVPSGQEEGMDIKGLKLSCYLNVAACQMRHHNYEMVVLNSSKALQLQSDNAKALYRRGSAYLQLQEYEKSKEDLMTAQTLEPNNQAVAKQLQLLKNQVLKLNQYYASAMKKLFA